MKHFFSRFRSGLFTLGFVLTIIGGPLYAMNLWGELSTRIMDNQSSKNYSQLSCAKPVNWVRIQNRISSIGEEDRIIVKISDDFAEAQCANSFSMEIVAPGFDVQPSLQQTALIAPNRYNSIEWTLIPKHGGNAVVIVRNEAESFTRGVFIIDFFGLNYLSMRLIGDLFFPIGMLFLEVDKYNRDYRKRIAAQKTMLPP